MTLLIWSILTIAVTEALRSEVFKSEKILEATLNDDLSSLHLTLRKNKSFQMTSVTMFSHETFNGTYNLTNDKIIFLDKPYDNDFIPDTLTIIGDKIILQFDSSGKPRTDFASFFSIHQNKL